MDSWETQFCGEHGEASASRLFFSPEDDDYDGCPVQLQVLAQSSATSASITSTSTPIRPGTEVS